MFWISLAYSPKKDAERGTNLIAYRERVMRRHYHEFIGEQPEASSS
jgi:hypothetical protein